MTSRTAKPITAVSRDHPTPLYHQVEVDLRARIEDGEWHEGSKIPGEEELTSLYGASRITIRRALDNLAAQGWLTREPGRGTFVRRKMVTAQVRALDSFSREMVGLGYEPGAKVLGNQITAASTEIADALRIVPGEQVVVIRRVRLADSAPIGRQTAWLPASRFPGLEHADLTDRSLYNYLEEHYGLVLQEAEELFMVDSIGAADAKLLEVAPQTPGFRVERVSFDNEGPVEFVTSIFRGDHYRVRLALRRDREQGKRTGTGGLASGS